MTTVIAYRKPTRASADLMNTKIREGSYFPGFFESRPNAEKALVVAIQKAYIRTFRRANWAI